jgi:hypothetical protein
MYASIRRYRLHDGLMDELMSRVDSGFAEEIAGRPGFCSYEALDCGDGEVLTVSIFSEADQAEASRELALQWSADNLDDLEFDRIEALQGEVRVSRAGQHMLEAAHAETSNAFASVRRYALRRGSVDELMRIVDQRFADMLAGQPGFLGYHVLVRDGEILAISTFASQVQAEYSDQLALDFVREELGAFDIERTDVIGGNVLVSRARPRVLEPAHA